MSLFRLEFTGICGKPPRNCKPHGLAVRSSRPLRCAHDIAAAVAAAMIRRSGSQAEEAMRKSGHWATGTVLFLLCLMYGITYIDRVNISTAAIAFRQELN